MLRRRRLLRAEDPGLPVTVPPGPDNPLGAFALDLAWPRIVIHGTNRPYGVGRRVSHGCIRLHDADITALFRNVPAGTPVRFVNQVVKAGWSDDQLWLSVHPSPEQAAAIEESRLPQDEEPDQLDATILRAAGSPPPAIDRFAVRLAATMRTGLPVAIARRESVP